MLFQDLVRLELADISLPQILVEHVDEFLVAGQIDVGGRDLEVRLDRLDRRPACRPPATRGSVISGTVQASWKVLTRSETICDARLLGAEPARHVGGGRLARAVAVDDKARRPACRRRGTSGLPLASPPGTSP